MKKKVSNDERRQARRRPILDSFSLFVVVPSKGPNRLKVFDLSERGIGFHFDDPAEDPSSYPLEVGAILEICLYLNQTLKIVLEIEVARVQRQEPDGARTVGASFTGRPAAGMRAVAQFVQLLDALSEPAEQ